MHRTKNQRGITLPEICITSAILVIMSAISIPNLHGWTQNYKLQSFSRNIFSDMHKIRINAIKHNKKWKIEFNSHGYMIQDNNGNTFEDVKFQDYSNGIKFGRPNGGDSYDNNPLIFNSSGMLDTAGFVYVTDEREAVYYRVGTQFTTGIIRVEKWNGSGWK